jgi:hypothetical protein
MKKNIISLTISVVFLLLISLALYWNLQRKNSLNQDDYKNKTFYLVSPVEWAYLIRENEIWPNTFHRNFPLESERMPDFFSLVEKQPKFMLLSPWEIEYARSWNTLINANHRQALLKDLLKENAEASDLKSFLKSMRFAEYPKCHLMWLESLFRLAQLKIDWRKDILQTVSGCEQSAEAFEWFKAEDALRAEGVEEKKKLAEEFNHRETQYDSRSFGAYYFEQLTKLLDYAVMHGKKFQFEP